MELKDRVLIDLDYIKDCIDEIAGVIEDDEIELPLYLKNLIEQCKNNVEITIKEWEGL